MAINFKKNKYSDLFLRDYIKNNDVSYSHWAQISEYQELTLQFIRDFKEKINWYYITRFKQLSNKFIKEFENYIDWDYIWEEVKVSESFMRMFQQRLYWSVICIYQSLSEAFILEFKDNFNSFAWGDICLNQSLSTKFIKYLIKEEFITSVHFYKLLKNQNIDQEKLKKHLKVKVHPSMNKKNNQYF